MSDIHLGNLKNCCGSSQDHNESDTQFGRFYTRGRIIRPEA